VAYGHATLVPAQSSDNGVSPYVAIEASTTVDAGPAHKSRWLVIAVFCVAVAAFGVGAVITPPILPALKLKRAPASPPHTGEWCTGSGAATYSKQTLKAVADRTISGLLPYSSSSGISKFEASDVIRLGDKFYAVCDSSWSIVRLSHSLPLLSSDNTAIDPVKTFVPPDNEDSGFEALVHDATDQSGSSFYVVRESLVHPEKGSYHAAILNFRFTTTDTGADEYAVTETCWAEFEFEGDSKGFEGATSLRGADGVLYLLGLCEGNFCSERRGKEVGNGRVIVMRRVELPAGCLWKTVRTLELPKSVSFIDYSALAIHHSTKAVAITSQETSQLWVGTLTGGADGQFDPATASFTEGTIYDFPRTASSCEVQYCNIEGIHWVYGNDLAEDTPQMLVAVSDKMKSKGKQPAVCQDKDQSTHLFTLP